MLGTTLKHRVFYLGFGVATCLGAKTKNKIFQVEILIQVLNIQVFNPRKYEAIVTINW